LIKHNDYDKIKDEEEIINLYGNVPYSTFMKGAYNMISGEELSAIGTVGFPIVMCLLMGKYITTVNDSHKEESRYFTEAINRNTEAITKMQSTLDHIMKDGADI
jgi:hypothetical protein